MRYRFNTTFWFFPTMLRGVSRAQYGTDDMGNAINVWKADRESVYSDRLVPYGYDFASTAGSH
ncbi:MAG: hypothetical protein E6Q97_16855 [Desulfurellales bacterium]|nr:MAG: hypothetical protein E6Q97_16855 [Desulfurellales bacterium]